METIPFVMPGTVRTPPATSKYMLRLQKVKQYLTSKGIGSNSAVFIAASDIEDEDELSVNPTIKTKALPQITEVYGEYAAVRLCERTHRLATPEEQERFFNEQHSREEACAVTTAALPENKQATALVAALTARHPQLHIPVQEPPASAPAVPMSAADSAARPAKTRGEKE